MLLGIKRSALPRLPIDLEWITPGIVCGATA